MENNQKVYLEPYTPDTKDGFIRQEKPKHESVADVKKLYYLLLMIANV